MVVPAHANTSGYVYLNIPKIICQQCSIMNKTIFIAVVNNGKLILRQEV